MTNSFYKKYYEKYYSDLTLADSEHTPPEVLHELVVKFNSHSIFNSPSISDSLMAIIFLFITRIFLSIARNPSTSEETLREIIYTHPRSYSAQVIVNQFNTASPIPSRNLDNLYIFREAVLFRDRHCYSESECQT